jgi:hypothetical protein
MPLSIDDVLDAYIENADYQEQASVAKARKLVTAATRYLAMAPQSQSDQGSSLTISVDAIQAEKRRAESFIKQNAAATSANSRVRFLSAGYGFRR